jgi:SAM-dependent methyltransferase
MAQMAMQREADLMRGAGVIPGARIVDMGCGPGAVLVELARIAGDGGEVVGVEPDPTARAAAAQAINESGLTNARVIDGKGTSSGLNEGVWDAVTVRHVLFHVGADAQDLVAHAAALVRPGGHVYLVDTDLGARGSSPTKRVLSKSSGGTPTSSAPAQTIRRLDPGSTSSSPERGSTSPQLRRGTPSYRRRSSPPAVAVRRWQRSTR